ncbi:MAG: hypothetical protein LBO69_04255 [Ignavibacteria bacterium]|nr:hypothetical protein [Ignavibacteria bacterium]
MLQNLISKNTKNFIDTLKNKFGFTIHETHTSGHSDIPTLQELVTTLKPKHILPIYTLNPETYKSTFQNSDIVLVEDGEEVIM